MTIQAPRLPCYLVEWYRPQLSAGMLDDTAVRLDACAAGLCAEGKSVQLLMTLAVPADEVLFGVFAAGSVQSVTETCLRAGIPAERLSEAIDARLARS